ncbi:HNH endonuclease [Hymenobacter sp. BT683]|uniref:HNH endonuclease n=1 Tax=Hymenobacter jeongseonensis TaxID=2791027 RepID=A0ABS0IE35_9BACT|nr:NUMOD4 domain-containing protein [Hymenobacter jeongseonensis]MBF9236606.1 HNH endonuclease [Hymenobacter jeongseonensis]
METSNTEQWRDITSYEGIYQVSSEGNVYSVRFNRMLKPQLGKLGYYHVGLSVGGKVKLVHIHRLVALAFLSEPEGMVKPTVDHINYVKTDNQLGNLRWLSSADNSSRTSTDTRIHRPRGSAKPNAKLNEEAVRSIRVEYAAGGISAYKLAEKHGVSHTAVRSLIIKHSWTHIV